ncbi:hypothetical protein CsSME_00023550 [Camellia sinensis var. sinensis]
MVYWRLLFFLSHTLITITITIAQPEFIFSYCVPNRTNSTTTYEANLKTLFSSLSSAIDSYGFYNASLGQNSDRVNAIVLCRGDVELGICRSCVSDSTHKLIQVCPKYMEAIAWYDYCMLRYVWKFIFFIILHYDPAAVWNPENVSNVAGFNQALKPLLEKLRSQAAQGGSLRKFATGMTSADTFLTIYGLLQCTPDLSQQQCIDCLDRATSFISDCCNARKGARVLAPSCNLRYELNHFYNDTLVPPPSPRPGNSTTIVIIIATSVTGTVTILIVLFTIFLRKRKHKKPTEKIEITDEISGAESLRYDFSTVKDATDNFSDSNKLGQGGFGPVYKGKLPNGQEIAVKRLSKNSGQGEVEFKNEVLLVAKLQHRNLVRTLGFCMEGTERLLMYEFMPNGSLDHFLFDPNKQAYLDWDMRYKIIGGIARGLLYLHEDSRLRIIHRDMKASNVLLDENMNPKISDFGMARLFVLDETHGNTNKVVGTYGYMPPEYVTYGQFSIKSDVFSFGVLVLEIISGQKNSHFQKAENEENLLTYTWKNWKDGRASNVIDATILKASSNCVQDIMRCIHIGLLCVQENVANRPTMASVVLMLSSFSLTLSLPSQPAFFMQSTINPQSGSSNVNEASITELYPR